MSLLDRVGLGQLHDELTSDKATLTLPLITIYPASCDVAMCGVDVVLNSLTASPNEKLCSAALHTWKSMKVAKATLPKQLQRYTFRALTKCDPESVDVAAYFLKYLFNPYAKDIIPNNNYHSDVRNLLLHFNMDLTLVDLVIKKFTASAPHSDHTSIDTARNKFEAMRCCLISDKCSPPPAADHASYPTRQAAASRFFGGIVDYLTANPDLIVKDLDERILKAVCHYQLDQGCIRLAVMLQHAKLTQAILIPTVRLINSVYELLLPPAQPLVLLAADDAKREAIANLATLLPTLDRWEPALFGVDMTLAALPASLSTELVMSILRSWKQLLEWDVPEARSITLTCTTVDLFVTKCARTCIEPARFFVEQLYTPSAAWAGQPASLFYLHKLLFHCNMDSTLVDVFLGKWRSCQEAALVDVKCACLQKCLFEFANEGSTSTVAYVMKTDPRYSNQVSAYVRIVEEMLVCFRMKPELISKSVGRLFLHGIAHYGLEARCLPGLIAIIKVAKLDLPVRNQLLGGVLDQYKVEAKTAPKVATDYLGTSIPTLEWQLWLRLQKALWPNLSKSLSAHRKLLLGRVSSGATAEVVLSALKDKDIVDTYLRNVYCCIDEGDDDLATLLQFTTRCEQLPLPKLAALVTNLALVPIVPPRLKQAYHKLVHRMAVAVCELPSFPLRVVNGRPTFAATNEIVLHSDSAQLLLNYLGFTIDVLVNNIYSRRPADTLTEEAYDTINDLLCPLSSELEQQVSSSSSSSSTAADSSVRLTAAAKATRLTLFEKFMSKWRNVSRRDSLDELLNGGLLSSASASAITGSLQLLSLVERLNALQGKRNALPPATKNKYVLHELPARLPVGVLTFLQSVEVSTTMSPIDENDLGACRALADSIKLELSVTYLKDAIDVRPIKQVNGKHCVSLIKVYVSIDDECRSYSTLVQGLVTDYAMAKVEALPAAGHLGYSEEQTTEAKLLATDFIIGSFFPIALQPNTASKRVDPLASSSSSTSQPVATAIAAANNPSKEQQDPQLQQALQSGHKRPAATSLSTSATVPKKPKAI